MAGEPVTSVVATAVQLALGICAVIVRVGVEVVR